MSEAANGLRRVQRAPVNAMLIFGTQPLAIVMVVVDLVLVARWVAGETTTMLVLLSHAVITLVLCALAWVLQPINRMDTLGAMMTCLLMGPIGGFILVIVNLGISSRHRVMAPQTARAAMTSSADNLHAQIDQGRRRRLTGATATSFFSIFCSGSLARQQDAIASISLGYSAEMMPALQQALASDIPAIRVQAAAVFAKLRGEFSERAKAVLQSTALGAPSAALVLEAHLVARSGFVDDETAAALLGLSPDLELPRISQRRAPLKQQQGDPLLRPPRLKRHSCGGVA